MIEVPGTVQGEVDGKVEGEWQGGRGEGGRRGWKEMEGGRRGGVKRVATVEVQEKRGDG